MCSFATGAGATGAGSRVTTSAIGCVRVRVVTLEKKLIFCSCTVFVFIGLVYRILARGVTHLGCAANGSSFYAKVLLERAAPSIQTPATQGLEHLSLSC